MSRRWIWESVQVPQKGEQRGEGDRSCDLRACATESRRARGQSETMTSFAAPARVREASERGWRAHAGVQDSLECCSCVSCRFHHPRAISPRACMRSAPSRGGPFRGRLNRWMVRAHERRLLGTLAGAIAASFLLMYTLSAWLLPRRAGHRSAGSLRAALSIVAPAVRPGEGGHETLSPPPWAL